MKKLFEMMMAVTVLMTVMATAAMAADRDTPEREGRYVQVTAGATIGAGEMVAILPATALAYPAADTATMAVIGRAESAAVSNQVLLVKRGVFRWGNNGVFTAANIGQQCYVSNSTYVCTAAIAANDVPAGTIVDYDASGVWVDTYNQKITLTTTVTSLAVSGAATVGTTLGVTGVATFTAAPKCVATNAAGTVEATATNAPALAAAGMPLWVKVTVGTTPCVIPAYVLE